jgi:hypothetical protein
VIVRATRPDFCSAKEMSASRQYTLIAQPAK